MPVKVLSSTPAFVPSSNFKSFAMLDIAMKRDEAKNEWVASAAGIEKRHFSKGQALSDLESEIRDQRDRGELVL